MIGIGVGAIGLTLSDCLSLTLEEFGAIHAEWRAKREERMREGWEQTRFLATCLLSPYANKPIDPLDLVRFPWDSRKESRKESESKNVVTRADFERIRKQFSD